MHIFRVILWRAGIYFDLKLRLEISKNMHTYIVEYADHKYGHNSARLISSVLLLVTQNIFVRVLYSPTPIKGQKSNDSQWGAPSFLYLECSRYDRVGNFSERISSK